MAVYPIGDQRVGIELDVPVLDDDDQPTFDELGNPLVSTTVAWVDRALFEAQTPTEQPSFLVMTSVMAAAVLPVTADRVIPAVDDDGADASLSFFDTAGLPTINANARLIHNGMRYEMRGDAVLEQDIHGRADHVFCSCERKGL